MSTDLGRGVAVVLLTLLPHIAASAEGGLPIPQPSARPPVLAGELYVGLALPLADGRLCPVDQAGCVLGAGARVGGTFQRRWRRGISAGVGYDIMLLDGSTVFELTVIQSLRGQFQYAALPTRSVHPLVRLSGGPGIVGDSFRASALTWVAGISSGAEFEISERSAATLLVGVELIRSKSFTSSRDGVRRGTERIADVMLLFQAGYVFYGGQ